MLLYSQKITPRLQYVADFIGKQVTGEPFQLTTDSFYFSDYNGPKINYGYDAISNDEFLIVSYSLLLEDSIKKQNISCFELNGNKAFFRSDGDHPFDIFSAVFYLLSRYEEYLPHKKDRYGRYAHTNSLAFKEGFLDQPLINIWIEDFKKALRKKFPQLTIHDSRFTFEPTYDIDEAYSYKNKGALRTVGGSLVSIVNGEWAMVNERVKVLQGKSEDPFDSYEWMDSLHDKHHLKPKYFFLIPSKNAKYDKNILPTHPAMRQLIKQHAEKYDIGIHPSWQSGDDDTLLKNEIETLEQITSKKIISSRQHYIRFNLPNGYRRLIERVITDDYSMGYGSINGFRASVASSFYWYDLKKEQTTDLLLHPFCYMEANSFFEQKLTPAQAYEEMMHYYNVVKSVNGTLITLWHNTFLGTDKYYAGWREAYHKFIECIHS